MYKAFYAGNTFTALSLFALGLFIVFFLTVVFWVLAIKRPADFDAVAALPLDASPNPRVQP
jgi:cbb3-type cytochrome oxidase subunit 3